MSTLAMQTALANAQAAYVQLQSGSKAVTLSYTQGDGSKTVTYTPATVAGLVELIGQLQQQLGIVRHARRPIRLLWR